MTENYLKLSFCYYSTMVMGPPRFELGSPTPEAGILDQAILRALRILETHFNKSAYYDSQNSQCHQNQRILENKGELLAEKPLPYYAN
jgi:hypothetical protein